jgi:hypothetical protein
MLNPPMDTRIAMEDSIIHLAEDDYTSRPQGQLPSIDLSAEATSKKGEAELNHLLVLGCNEYLPDILAEYDPLDQ